jgi:hypothetical protein
MAHDVFISYSADDKPIADAMCSTLESKGIRCWIAPRDILPGMDWGSSIIDAIAASRVMVLLLSSNSNVSSQVKREVERAVNKEVIVIPFRIEDVRLSKSLEYHLSLTHWMDALTPPLEVHLQTLAEKIRQLLLAGSGAGNTSIRNMGKIPIPPLPSAYKRPTMYLGIGLVIGLIALGSLFLWWSRSRATPESEKTRLAPISSTPSPSIEQSKGKEKGASNKKQNVNNNAEPATGSQPRIPVINGKSYDVARKMLIKEGWQPNERRWSDVDDPSVQGGNGPVFWKRGYREVVSCAGTGAAECRFEFFDPNERVLLVITQGEEDDEGGKYHAVVTRVVLKK